MAYSVSIASLIKQYNLVPLNANEDNLKFEITHPEINRPALQLAGFYDYFNNESVQIIGNVEYAYMLGMTPEMRDASLKKLFERKLPCVVICRGLAPFPEMIARAKEKNVPLLLSNEDTSDFIADVARWMKVELAPRITIHGVLVDIYGEGVLITGESGIGKSETALELIKRGHRFVADDAVEIKKVSYETLIGMCPEALKYFIELRGIGIIDVMQMFGVQSIIATQNIDLVIKLEAWDNKNDYDRMGLTDEYIEILGNKIVCHSIPIRPGRNLSVICESAAINHRQKKMGYNAAHVLSERINANIARARAERNAKNNNGKPE